MRRWVRGAIEVTRVDDPGFELVLPQDPTTQGLLASRPWLSPHWITEDLALKVGSSAVLVRTPSAVIVVDPWLAFDDPARLAPRLSALRAAGVEPDDVDLVVNSHVDGIGANARSDGSPTFANARYLVPAAEVEDLESGVHPQLGDGTGPRSPWLDLLEQAPVERVHGGEQIVPGVHLEDAPGHNRGGVVLWIDSGGMQAVVVGHTFLHPAQIADTGSVQGDRDPVALRATREEVLSRCATTGALLVGPLFADPGAGRVSRDDRGWCLEPATDG